MNTIANFSDEVWGRIDYVQKNPLKEGLPAQHWEFVTPYDNWPLHKRSHTSLAASPRF